MLLEFHVCLPPVEDRIDLVAIASTSIMNCSTISRSSVISRLLLSPLRISGRPQEALDRPGLRIFPIAPQQLRWSDHA